MMSCVSPAPAADKLTDKPFLPRYVGRDAPSSRADVSASYRVDAPEGSDEESEA